MRMTVLVAFLSLGTIAQSAAQNLVQDLNVDLFLYKDVNNETIRMGTPELITYLWGSPVADGHLYLVTPKRNVPGQIGALGAFLRITSGTKTVYNIPSVSQFNLYQDYAAKRSYPPALFFRTLNRFSFDTGAIRAELQGVSLWSIQQTPVNGVDLSGAGAFTCTLSGWMQIYSVNPSPLVMRGTIIAGQARPE